MNSEVPIKYYFDRMRYIWNGSINGKTIKLIKKGIKLKYGLDQFILINFLSNSNSRENNC